MNLILYSILAIFNFSSLLYVIGTEHIVDISIFFAGLLVNQIMLLCGTKAVLNGEQNKSFLLVLKFFILILVFIFAVYKLDKYILFLTFSYIFQLIILVLSIKRDKENN
jgi:uncharacterized membrane protein